MKLSLRDAVAAAQMARARTLTDRLPQDEAMIALLDALERTNKALQEEHPGGIGCDQCVVVTVNLSAGIGDPK